MYATLYIYKHHSTGQNICSILKYINFLYVYCVKKLSIVIAMWNREDICLFCCYCAPNILFNEKKAMKKESDTLVQTEKKEQNKLNRKQCIRSFSVSNVCFLYSSFWPSKFQRNSNNFDRLTRDLFIWRIIEL